ncbi:DUF134 domain-containing protein [Prolixibacteraceae bacterium JC049]|nr:DUF134 domain-containing protein [Prolixibacteraceae bacterium JC049]
MVRPKKYRRMCSPPMVNGFIPFGTCQKKEEHVQLFFEEWEAIRLLDYDGMNQVDAAAQLNVSRPTLTRIYLKARKKMAEALVEGRALIIEGGDVHFDNMWLQCQECSIRFVVHDGDERKCPECGSDQLKTVSETVIPVEDQTDDKCKGCRRFDNCEKRKWCCTN